MSVGRAGCVCKCQCGHTQERKVTRKEPKLGGEDRTIKCYYCKKSGHMKRNCPRLRRQQHNHGAEALVSSTKERLRGKWIMDSGATQHMCPERTLFKNYHSLKVTRPVTTSDGHRMDAAGEGDIEVLAYNGKR